jgi:hypothetical protein
MGERRFKDIDEPERVYELVIEGAEPPEPAAPPTSAAAAAPAERDDDFETRVSDLAERMAKDIKSNVLRSLERSLGERGKRR